MPAELGIVNKGAKRDELYVEQNERGFTSFITCDIDGLYPAPGCDHTFGYRGLLMQISYRKVFLPEWRMIEQKVKDLLDSFMRQASLSGPWIGIQISRNAVSFSPCMTMSKWYRAALPLWPLPSRRATSVPRTFASSIDDKSGSAALAASPSK